jgi:hypothetical protein
VVDSDGVGIVEDVALHERRVEHRVDFPDRLKPARKEN